MDTYPSEPTTAILLLVTSETATHAEFGPDSGCAIIHLSICECGVYGSIVDRAKCAELCGIELLVKQRLFVEVARCECCRHAHLWWDGRQ